MRPRVLILATGGTIAGTAGSPEQTAAYRAGSLGIDELLARIPGLAEAADVGSEQVAAIDSKDATPEFWTHLASRVQAALDDERVAGVVVTHGTDTMEESAYFLHLTVRSAKPVVFTGAMRPATALSADGPLNLLQAVRVAAHPSAAGKGVLVAMNNLLHSARDVAKTNAQRVDAFACPDTGPLGFVQDGTVAWYRSTVRRHTARSELAWSDPMPAVEILSGYAGASPRLIEAVVGMQAAGIVYAGTGNGTLSAAAEAALAQAVRQGVAVVRASRVGSGAVLRNAAADDDVHGFVAAGNLNPQKARVLLMLALQRTRDTRALQAIFDAY